MSEPDDVDPLAGISSGPPGWATRPATSSAAAVPQHQQLNPLGRRRITLTATRGHPLTTGDSRQRGQILCRAVFPEPRDIGV